MLTTTKLLTVLAALSAFAFATASGDLHVVKGSSTKYLGKAAKTWAVKNGAGEFQEVGVSIPWTAIETPPDAIGKGPAGSFIVVDFPKEVQQKTFLDHFEMHWNPKGHEPACCFAVAHYDFHFFGVKPKELLKIPAKDKRAPDADHSPAGYIYPGDEYCIAEMGSHMFMPQDVDPSKQFEANMIAGYYDGTMTFFEPMVLRSFLRAKKAFAFDVPIPKIVGRDTLMPRKVSGSFDEATKCYRLLLTDFVRVK